MTKHTVGGMTWANRITIVRLLLTPVIIIGLVKQAPHWPLALYCFAAFTDFLDGAVARWRNERTKLGSFLDPIADKLLLSASFLALAHNGVLPFWVFIVVFSRDLLILIGWNVVYVLTKLSAVEPRFLGKATTFVQMSTVIAALLWPGTAGLGWVLALAVLVTALSTVEYVWLGSRKLGELG